MSLINEALKRASQSQRLQGSSPAPGTPLKPAETRTRSPNSALSLAPIVILALAGVAGWFFWKYWQANHPSAAPIAASQPPATGPAVAGTPAGPPAPSPAKPVAAHAAGSNPTAPPAAVTTKPPVPRTTTAPPSANPPAAVHPSPPEAPPAKVEFPPLRLQIIYFRMSKPEVMLNGQLLTIGDSLDNGVKVVAIDRQSVTLELNGQRKVLNLR